MARPRTVRTYDPENLRRWVLPQQQTRFEILCSFAAIISSPESLVACRDDDRFFSETLDLSCNDYRVEHKGLADFLGYAPGVVGKWARCIILPPKAVRSLAFIYLAEQFNRHIESELARKAANDAHGELTVLRGYVRRISET